MKLSELSRGETARVCGIARDALARLRLLELGFVPGSAVQLLSRGNKGDTFELRLRGARLVLRKSDAQNIFVEREGGCGACGACRKSELRKIHTL